MDNLQPAADHIAEVRAANRAGVGEAATAPFLTLEDGECRACEWYWWMFDAKCDVREALNGGNT